MDASTIVRPPRTRDADRVAALLAEARLRLIDKGTRNRLVHTNRKGKRPSTLAILHPNVAELFEQLVRRGATLPFRSDPRMSARANEESDHPPSPPPTLSNDVLQTRVAEETLQKRLLKLYRDAKTLEEEQGVNILYLAFGFLRWYEDEKSEVLREAPLVLVPVSLIRDVRRSTFDLRVYEDEISTNLPLLERLREDFGIALPTIPEHEEWTTADYFDSIAQAVQSQRRWSLDPDGIELGLFSFAKLLMFKDLAGEAWPNEAILDHPLLRGLLVTGFEAEAPLFPDDTKLDARFEPSDLVHVVDADGSQTLAIETVRAGRNLVVQGPPGTGKSQTIANIIASAVHDGKTVLFVAEKMVALEVVHSRLTQAGIGAACLELHSRSANKRLVSEELGQTLALGAAEPNLGRDSERLKSVRDRLNVLSERLHKPVGNTGMTPFRALGHLVRAIGRGQPPAQLNLASVGSWDAPTYERARSLTGRLAELVATAGRQDAHPWRGVTSLKLQPLDLARLEQRLVALGQRLDGLERLALLGATSLGQAHPTSFAQIDELLRLFQLVASVPMAQADAVRRFAGLRQPDRNSALAIAVQGNALQEALKASESAFRSGALEADTASIRSALARGVDSWLARLGPRYRKGSAELRTWLSGVLPKRAADRIALVDELQRLKAQRDAFRLRELEGALLFGPLWASERTEFRGLLAAGKWVAEIASKGSADLIDRALKVAEREEIALRFIEKIGSELQEIRRNLATVIEPLQVHWGAAFGAEPDTVPLREVAERVRLWAASPERYTEWVELSRLDYELRALGAEDIAIRLADGRLPADQATNEVEYARAEVVWKMAIGGDPMLARPHGDERSALVAEFKRLDTERRAAVAALIRARHSANIPRGAMGEMAVIRGEVGRKRGHMAIRKLIQRAGRTVQAIKPVFMMSPISVAQYLAPGTVTFDLVVIDEASQVRPEDALGVIGRAGQVVVVGDRKQLPPTNFFSRLLADDVDDEEDEQDAAPLAGAARATELESILTLCEARGLPDKMLRWHYRSRHPSLIEVSNAEFYQSNLFLPPAPSAHRAREGLVLRSVPGAYDRGGKRTNAIEAQAIVDAIANHASDASEMTLGIVTFSTAQRDLVSNLLDERRRSDPILDSFLRRDHEEVFVKNLENVQGDERDVILISIGYGPRQPGAKLDSMNFGPVSTEGGERRLNVLFTRARHRCEVFASFSSGDIDLGRATGQGPRVLKRFLAYAETGALDLPDVSAAEYDSPFEEDVAEVVRSMGYIADPQVGSAGFRLDLGVRDPQDPGRYILAIECDGAAYHGALWARERDRLRQEILEGLGWRFHRIWSTDWFYRRSAEIDTLKRVLAETQSVHTAPLVEARRQPSAPPEPPSLATSEESAPNGQIYQVACFEVATGMEPHEVPVARMSEVVERIVAFEGPIHSDEVGRRVAALFGKERAGARISAAALKALRFLGHKNSDLIEEDGFWMTTQQRVDCPIRNRSQSPITVQRAEMIPPIEIQAALRQALKQNGGMDKTESAIAVARVLGFQRTGQELRATIDRQVVRMIQAGTVGLHDGMLRLVPS
jgi:hypothetical protein